MQTQPILLTPGDPNGAGPEILAEVLKRHPDISGECLLIIDPQLDDRYFQNTGVQKIIITPSEAGRIYTLHPGEKNPDASYFSYLFLERASLELHAGNGRAVLTGPVSKEGIVSSGVYEFIDHTTYFAHEFKSEVNMLFYSRDFCVILATIHEPVYRVPQVLTPAVLEKTIRNAYEFCLKTMRKGFKIALCGLNPHAGEGGLLGSEEKEWMNALAERMRSEGIPMEGPLPADTVFFDARMGKYQMVVAQYHDQGLAPFKMLHFHDGVNVTLGLPFIRTSPDHGTAFNLAGTGKADTGSMEEALLLALALSKK